MENKIIILPNGTKVTVKDFVNAIVECINDEKKNVEYSVKKTFTKAKKAAVVATLAATVTASLMSQIEEKTKEKVNNNPEVVTEAGVELYMADDKTILTKAGVALHMPEKINVNKVKEADIKEVDDKKDTFSKYEKVFVGYDLPNVSEERKEIVKEYQRILYDKCQQYGIPFNVMMVIFDNESGGLFNTNGAINRNSNGTFDCGLFQINSCNHQNIKDNLEITQEQLLNDPEKNIEAACFHFKTEIIDRYGKNYIEDINNNNWIPIFAIYNGGKGNMNTKAAQKYGYNAQAKLDTEYNKLADELTMYIYDKDDENEHTR